MYQPNERFAKAYQEELLREARHGDRPDSRSENGFFLSRFLSKLFSTGNKANSQPLDAGDARKPVLPIRTARSRG